MRVEDKIIFNEIRKGNKVVYESLFKEYYKNLVRFAEGYLFDQQISEDIVQELFIHIWEHASRVHIHTSIKSYFYTSIRNRCLNHLRVLKVKNKNKLLYLNAIVRSEDNLEFFEPAILQSIKESLDELPPKMAEIFKLRFMEGLKRKEIAEQLDISVNTVGTHIKRGRVKLKKITLVYPQRMSI